MRVSSGALLMLGALAMLIALGCQNITLASNDYRILLLLALACMTIADLCFAVVAHRGDIILRSIALLMASSSLFIIWDFLRRIPYMFAK